ncbi:MAG: hypothetical protein NZ899_07435 [Thermoguttaceae bacterium]|nr:hypothetical protein [Thermoguttaceae bacterium]MDW8078975.1 prenyltransferase/squalene oxidase repeat-containing protein [Thermoguttaceae bacterium]
MRGNGFLHGWLEKLRAVVEGLPKDWRLRHSQFLTRSCLPDGGFAGRQGPASAYYTSFGLRGLFLLGAVDEDLCRRCRRFLAELKPRDLPPADLFAAIFSAPILGEHFLADWDVTHQFASLARPDGGFALTPAHGFGSVYGTYLVAESCSLLAVDLPSPGSAGSLAEKGKASEVIVDFLLSRQRADGGFAEAPFVPCGGTPATAAALATFRLLESGPDLAVKKACKFLTSMQQENGGFLAAPTSPVPDLLSTAVALLVLHDRGMLSWEQRWRAGKFVAMCEKPEGGYGASPRDQDTDVEYTFYGVLAQAILACQV